MIQARTLHSNNCLRDRNGTFPPPLIRSESDRAASAQVRAHSAALVSENALKWEPSRTTRKHFSPKNIKYLRPRYVTLYKEAGETKIVFHKPSPS